MVTEHIRQNFHRLIDRIADEKALAQLYEVAELYLDQKELLLDTEDHTLLSRMESSLKQAENGEFISNHDIQQQVKEWLGK